MAVDIPAFLRRVIPWPSLQHPEGVVNIHWSTPDSKGKPIGGKPFQKLEDFLSFTQWATLGTGQKFVRDMYFCTSLQERTGVVINGKPKVLRNAANSLNQKAIFADIDIKPKAYTDLDKALQGLQSFVTVAPLPPPSALVNSGGGLHVYWISDRALPIREWMPYAYGLRVLAEKHGLLCDFGVTTDCARILRIPGTFNYKETVPRPVKLLALADTDYNFETELAHIKVDTSAIVIHTSQPRKDNLILFDIPRGLPPITDPEYLKEIAYGGDPHEPLDPRPILTQCPMFKKAFADGGRHHSQGQWMLIGLGCTFIKNGRALFHDLSKGHPTYTPAETDEMYDRKEGEDYLGWPSCKAFADHGSKECAGCLHNGSVKSPLNLEALYPWDPPDPAPVASPSTSTALVATNIIPFPPSLDGMLAQLAQMLPRDYYLGDHGWISKDMQISTGTNVQLKKRVPIFKSVIYNPWLQLGQGLHFTVETDKGHTREVLITRADTGAAPHLCTRLAAQDVMVGDQQKEIHVFTTTFISKLQREIESREATAFGWMRDKDGVWWWAYAGLLHGPNGQIKQAGTGDAETTRKYTPTGELQPWLDALKLITARENPALEAIIAAAFAAPLVMLTGDFAATLAATGEGGAGKSTAVDLALSVWGHPKQTKQTGSSSEKAGMGAVGETHNLPAIWDDMSTPGTLARVATATQENTEGVAGAKLAPDRTQIKRNEWRTVMVATSNKSVFDHMMKKNKDNTGLVGRLFEFDVGPFDKGRIAKYDAPIILDKVSHNYGMMGRSYSMVLGTHMEALAKEIHEESKRISEEVNETNMERFWRSLCVVIVVAAETANKLGCDFHIPELRAFMIEQYYANRKKVTEANLVGASLENTDEALQQFYKACVDHVLRVDGLAKQGRYQTVAVLSSPRNEGATHVQWARKQRVMRISRRAFTDWLNRENYVPSLVIRGLRTIYKARDVKANMTAGTTLNGPEEYLFEIPIVEGSWMEEEMEAATPLVSRGVREEADKNTI
jgi:Domain of unknown function (DUF927)